MRLEQSLMAFTVAAALLTITPGVDTALVLRTAAVEGRRRAMLAGTGICLGCLMWGLGASLGIGFLFSASRLAYDGLRLAGAGYLIFLGVKMFRSARVCPLEFEGLTLSPYAPRVDRAGAHWFVRGLLTNLLNPKVGVFYVTFLPQFVPPGVSVVWFSMLLAAIHAVEGVLWFVLLTLVTNFFAQWLRRAGVSAFLDRATGLVLMTCGVALIARQR